MSVLLISPFSCGPENRLMSQATDGLELLEKEVILMCRKKNVGARPQQREHRPARAGAAVRRVSRQATFWCPFRLSVTVAVSGDRRSLANSRQVVDWSCFFRQCTFY